MTLNYTRITLPNVENILKFSEEAVLQTETTLPLHIQRLDENAARDVSRNHVRGAEVARVVNALQEDKRHQPISWLWFVGIVILSMVIVSLWPL